MQDREVDFRPECSVLYGFCKRRGSNKVVHIAAISIFYYAWLAICVANNVLVGCKNIMQVYLGHNAECKQQQQRAARKTPYDCML